MRDRISAAQVNERRTRYLMDQQIGIHVTIVSIALAVAGLAAAGLLVISSADRPYRILFWLLWITSLLYVGVVYSGMTVSVYILPGNLPNAIDMFLRLRLA